MLFASTTRWQLLFFIIIPPNVRKVKQPHLNTAIKFYFLLAICGKWWYNESTNAVIVSQKSADARHYLMLPLFADRID